MIYNNRRFETDFRKNISSQHVYFPLIHPELCDVCLKMMNVCCLHQRIKNLCTRVRYILFAPHNLPTPHNALDSGMHGKFQDSLPIIWMLSNKIRSPNKLNIIKVHTAYLPYFNEILSNSFDFLKISPHFIIQVSKPISNPESKMHSCRNEFIDSNCAQQPLCNVDLPTRLKTIISDNFLLCLEQSAKFLFTYYFLSKTPHNFNLLINTYLFIALPLNL